jgi:hypothetical protein
MTRLRTNGVNTRTNGHKTRTNGCVSDRKRTKVDKPPSHEDKPQTTTKTVTVTEDKTIIVLFPFAKIISFIKLGQIYESPFMEPL